MITYSPGTSPVRYSGISDLSNSPSGKKILLSGPENEIEQVAVSCLVQIYMKD